LSVVALAWGVVEDSRGSRNVAFDLVFWTGLMRCWVFCEVGFSYLVVALLLIYHTSDFEAQLCGHRYVRPASLFFT